MLWRRPSLHIFLFKRNNKTDRRNIMSKGIFLQGIGVLLLALPLLTLGYHEEAYAGCIDPADTVQSQQCTALGTQCCSGYCGYNTTYGRNWCFPGYKGTLQKSSKGQPKPAQRK